MFATEKQKVETVLKGLRSKFSPKTPDLEILATVLRGSGEICTPETVEKFARARKTFSTADVMQHFQVSKYKVAGSLAALRRANKLSPGESTKDGYSTWMWVTRKTA